jgi:hypothetical protein
LEVPVATEAWIAAALLHREQPDRADFTIQEIVARAETENLTGSLRPGVNVHVAVHCVANRPPNPARLRMLFATGKRTRRLFREGDEALPERTGRITPEPESIPSSHRYLLDWYRNEYNQRPTQSAQRNWLSGVVGLAGAGHAVFSDVDPDRYVAELREGWQ